MSLVHRRMQARAHVSRRHLAGLFVTAALALGFSGMALAQTTGQPVRIGGRDAALHRHVLVGGKICLSCEASHARRTPYDLHSCSGPPGRNLRSQEGGVGG